MQHGPDAGKKNGGPKGWLWMVLCCLPMIAIIVLAVLSLWRSR